MKVKAGNALFPPAFCKIESVCALLSYFDECHVGRKDLMINQGQLAKISRLQAHLTANYWSGKRAGQNHHIFSPMHISSCEIRKSIRYLRKYCSQSTFYAHDFLESIEVIILIQNQLLPNYFLFFLCIADVHKVILSSSFLRQDKTNNLLQEAVE